MRSAVLFVAALCGSCAPTAMEDGGGGPDAGAGPDAPPATDMCGDVRAVPRVYNGTAAPTYVPLSSGQILAIGSFGGCSGTLVAPTWVLTATHCGLRAGDEFCMGETPDAPETCIAASRVVDNPDSDQTLAELERDARELLPGVVPIPIMTEAMDPTWIGRTAEAAGYGQQENGDYGAREFTAEPIVMLEGHELVIDGQGMRGVCFGDSGGPVMVIAADATVRVAGDLSWGDPSCLGQDHFTRTDTSVAWIEELTGPTVVEGATCGDLDAVGRCVAGSAQWCGEGDLLETEQCAAACGWDAARAGFRCISGVDSCGGYDRSGGCDGQVARWCEGGEARRRDCGACGQLCRMVAGVGATCVEDECMGLDYLGRCDGDVAVWCENDLLQSEDCAAQGKTCEYVNDEIGYYCR